MEQSQNQPIERTPLLSERLEPATELGAQLLNSTTLRLKIEEPAVRDIVRRINPSELLRQLRALEKSGAVPGTVIKLTAAVVVAAAQVQELMNHGDWESHYSSGWSMIAGPKPPIVEEYEKRMEMLFETIYALAAAQHS